MLQINEKFPLFGMSLYSMTGVERASRAEEIAEWLEREKKFGNKNVDNFAIIDDGCDAGIGFKDHFFQTTMAVGITQEIADRVVAYLGEKQPKLRNRPLADQRMV